MGPRVYEFRPMSIADLTLVRRWLAAPEVTQWWGDANEQFELIFHRDRLMAARF